MNRKIWSKASTRQAEKVNAMDTPSISDGLLLIFVFTQKISRYFEIGIVGSGGASSESYRVFEESGRLAG
jgi:hypothetical protein